MSELTNQEVFDLTAKHMKKQKLPARGVGLSNGGPLCLYRQVLNNEVRMCNVGHLIPEEIYTIKMESGGIHSLVDGFGDILPESITKHVDLLERLQVVHDSVKENHSLLTTYTALQMEKVAKDFHLNPAEVDW